MHHLCFEFLCLDLHQSLATQAGTLFCDAGFQREVATGKISATSVGTFTCIALAGVAAEFLCFGQVSQHA